MTTDLTRLRSAIRDATAVLRAAGVPSPQADAHRLAAFTLGRDQLVLAMAPPVPATFEADYGEVVQRRARRTPLQHILGSTGFRHLEVRVEPGVFTPRPETEVVAQAAIDEARAVLTDGREPVVVDLCCGSGVIALSVATEVVAAHVTAVDLSTHAVELTRRNAEQAGVTGMRLEQGDVGDPAVLADLDETVDVVVTNPPYIPVGAVVRDPEVVEHDPPLALWSGADGLDLMRALEVRASALLRPGGLLVAEHADQQGEAAPAVFAASGRWDDVRDHLDLAGRARYVTARRKMAVSNDERVGA